MANLDDVYVKDKRQQAFVDHKSGTLVALAGPGTGKTYSFLLRIEELIEKRHIDSTAICYLTFNREIARAFKNDLLSKYPGAVPPQPIRASTLHSLACRLIRNQGHRIQLDGDLCILDLGNKKNGVAKIAVKDMWLALPKSATIPTDTKMRQHLRVIKTERQKGRSMDNLTGDNAHVEGIYQVYSRALKLLDWDEIIPLAISLYSDEDDRPDWINEYQHFLIDEYQDFNIAEQIFLTLISESAISRVIVGDDDQSIYSSKGASPNGIKNLVQDSETDSISLVLCWIRPPKQIVESVNRFLSFMNDKPRLLTAVEPGGVIAIKSFISATSEADYLVEHIKDLLSLIDENTPLDDGVVCLFYRRNVLSHYRKEFEKRGLKCKCKDSSDSLDDKMWVRILGKLAFQRNQPFLERLILDRFPNFKPRHKKAVIAALLNGHTSVSSALSSIGHNHGWKEPALTAMSEYIAFIQSLTSGDTARIASCIDSVLPNGKQCNPYFVDDLLAENDETILEESLDILIDRIYRDDEEESDELKFDPEVELLTLHSSKGLTRRHVILPGLEHYWFPGDCVGDDLDERKRLFLVGITRTTESLLITYPRNRTRNDSLNLRKPGCLELSNFAEHLGITEERL